MAGSDEIHVVAGALRDSAGRILIAQRPRGRHMAGRWEFPGGKLAAGEDALEGLRRELSEELGIVVQEARPLIQLRHEYPDRHVLLDVWQVTRYEGVPHSLDQQALAWVLPDDLPRQDLLAADRGIVTALRLPRIARVLGDPGELAVLAGGVPQAVFWPLAESGEGLPERGTVQALRAAGHRVFIMGDDFEAVRAAATTGCDGAVLHWHGQQLHVDQSGVFLIGVHCEDIKGALEAVSEGAHFLVIAPADSYLSERYLRLLSERAGIPMFSGWHPDASKLERLQRAGAHGCAIKRK